MMEDYEPIDTSRWCNSEPEILGDETKGVVGNMMSEFGMSL